MKDTHTSWKNRRSKDQIISILEILLNQKKRVHIQNLASTFIVNEKKLSQRKKETGSRSLPNMSNMKSLPEKQRIMHHEKTNKKYGRLYACR